MGDDAHHKGDDAARQKGKTAVTKPGAYDLGNRPDAGPKIPHPERIRSEEEVAELVMGYIDVPAEVWPSLEPGSQVRFRKRPAKEGEPGKFLMGGKVVKYEPSTNDLWMKTGHVNDHHSFPIHLDEIETVWLQPYKPASVELTMLINTVKELSKRVKQLEARLAKQR